MAGSWHRSLGGSPETDKQRLAAIGYCYGGTAALELAQYGANLKGVVGFHSGLGAAKTEDSGSDSCKSDGMSGRFGSQSYRSSPKTQLLRDFRRRSIFDFYNKICQQWKNTIQIAMRHSVGFSSGLRSY